VAKGLLTPVSLQSDDSEQRSCNASIFHNIATFRTHHSKMPVFSQEIPEFIFTFSTRSYKITV